MIHARFLVKDGQISGFEVRGHAGYDDAGRDIACASVTSAVQMAANTVTEVLGVPAKVTVEEAKVALLLPEAPAEGAGAAGAVLKGLLIYLSLLAEEFAGCISVENREVFE